MVTAGSRVEYSWHQQVETRVVTQRPTMHRIVAHNNGLSVSKRQSAEVERSCHRLKKSIKQLKQIVLKNSVGRYCCSLYS